MSWEDTTDDAREWFVELAEKIRREGLPPLGFHLILGPDFSVMAQNQGRNLREGRIVMAQVIGKKAG
jgi:MPBQ/MSBQ methyltransferase